MSASDDSLDLTCGGHCGHLQHSSSQYCSLERPTVAVWWAVNIETVAASI